MTESNRSEIISTNSVFPNFQQFRETCSPQEFPFPLPTMKYIWQNPSTPKFYQKFQKSCKLFFIKYPILVVKNMAYYNKIGYSDIEIRTKNFGTVKDKKFDIDKINAKIWVINCLGFDINNISNISSTFIKPKFYRNDAKSLTIYCQKLSFDELKFLSPGIEDCSLIFIDGKYDNGELIELEDIIKLFSNCREFFMISSSKAVVKSYEAFIDNCKTIKKLKLSRMPDNFIISEFYRHLKSSKSLSRFYIESSNDPALLDEVIDEILQTRIFDFVPPVIFYPGMERVKLLRMKGKQIKVSAKLKKAQIAKT